jgi:N-acetylneuraminic acid mutarotase
MGWPVTLQSPWAGTLSLKKKKKKIIIIMGHNRYILERLMSEVGRWGNQSKAIKLLLLLCVYG